MALGNEGTRARRTFDWAWAMNAMLELHWNNKIMIIMLSTSVEKRCNYGTIAAKEDNAQEEREGEYAKWGEFDVSVFKHAHDNESDKP